MSGASKDQLFADLKEMSEAESAVFEVTGSAEHFSIIEPTYPKVTGAFTAAAFIPFLVMFFQTPMAPVVWLVFMATILLLFICFRFFIQDNRIIVDRKTRAITIQEQNFIAKFVKPDRVIKFDDISEIDFVRKRSNSSNNVKIYHNRVFVAHNGKKTRILNLLDGPIYRVDEKRFVRLLSDLILEKEAA